jgi:hypothetical protein
VPEINKVSNPRIEAVQHVGKRIYSKFSIWFKDGCYEERRIAMQL